MSLSADDIADIASLIAPGTVSVEPERLARMSMDIFEWAQERPADLLLAPASVEGVSACLAWAGRKGIAIAPRGGGMSYTRGFQPRSERIALMDLRALDGVRHFSPENRIVVVEAGCTWNALENLLKPHGLRPALDGPISGAVSTIGGAVSQGMPGGMQHILGLEIVLSDGRVVTTGALARPGSPGALRSSGPDLTGLFIGDCGALAIKTAIAIRLSLRPLVAECASFGFADPVVLAEAIAAVQARNCGVKVMGLAERNVQAAAAATSLREGLALIRRTIVSSGSLTNGLGRAARLALVRGKGPRPAWGLHLTAEANSPAIASAMLADAISAVPSQGVALAPTVPIAMQTRLYSVRGMLGPGGERWAPVHGIFPLQQIGPATRAIAEFLESRKARIEQHGITHSMMFSAQDTNVLVEPMLYWPDSLRPVHASALRPDLVKRFADNPANEKAREMARALRLELRDLLLAQGAMMAQLGQYYPYEDLSEEPARQLARSIKQLLDPEVVLNPGNFDWEQGQ